MSSPDLSLAELSKNLGAGISVIDPLSDPRWDRFVERHPLGWITHLSGWKKALESAFSHMTGYYLVLSEPDGKAIRAGLPLYSVESWLTGKRLVSIPFATLSDPLVTDDEDMEQLFSAAVSLLERLQLPRMEIKTFSSTPLLSRCRCISSCSDKHHSIELCNDPERIKRAFHRTCVKQRIARAERSGLRIVSGVDETQLQNFYLLHRMTRRRRALPPQPYKFIKAICDAFAGTGLVDLVLTFKDDVPLGGVIVFKFGNRVSVEFCAVDHRYRHFSPVHLLFWNAIFQSCIAGYHVLDFGRTSVRNKTLMDFKAHWGTTITDLPHFYYPTPPSPTRLQDASLQSWLFRCFCTYAPDFALLAMGEFCYQHMG